jgi:hypothetical protein
LGEVQGWPCRLMYWLWMGRKKVELKKAMKVR